MILTVAMGLSVPLGYLLKAPSGSAARRPDSPE
jgi:hypothetical protein